MNTVDFTNFVQAVVNEYNLQYSKLQRIADQDKLTGWDHYKKNVGIMQGIKECNDYIISLYNSISGNTPTIVKENVPTSNGSVSSAITNQAQAPVANETVEGQ